MPFPPIQTVGRRQILVRAGKGEQDGMVLLEITLGPGRHLATLVLPGWDAMRLVSQLEEVLSR